MGSLPHKGDALLALNRTNRPPCVRIYYIGLSKLLTKVFFNFPRECAKNPHVQSVSKLCYKKLQTTVMFLTNWISEWSSFYNENYEFVCEGVTAKVTKRLKKI